MKKHYLPLITLALFFILSKSQAQNSIQRYGIIDTAELKMTTYNLEKDANACILFDKEDMTCYGDSVSIIHQKRIKIFNNNISNLANVHIPYYSHNDIEKIIYIEAETICLENNKVVITKVDPKLIYTNLINKSRKEIVFTFPNVKPGCIIEYKYKWKATSILDYSNWYFQSNIPTRYSEYTATVSSKTKFNIISKSTQAYAKDTSIILPGQFGETYTKYDWVKTNVPPMKEEPFVIDGNESLQRISFKLTFAKTDWHGTYKTEGTWMDIADDLLKNSNFGGQFDRELSGQSVLLKQAEILKTTDEKIAYLFNEVKAHMKWSHITNYVTTEKGIRGTWNDKIGNTAEINLGLYHLLKKAGINAFPMLVGSRDDGVPNPYFADYTNIDKTVVYVPVDNTQCYVLDASSKYNTYDQIPSDLLNSYGIKIDCYLGGVKCQPIFLKNETPAVHLIVINAEIKPDSKISGSTTITNYSYSKAKYQAQYDDLGETKYKEFLQGKDNSFKISNLSFENMTIDSLPLVQKFNFSVDMGAASDNYIYLNPNLFYKLSYNPFLSETRYSDIDFGSCSTYSLQGTFKLADGYKVDALPKSTTLNMYDKSIVFKRVVNESNGTLQVLYTITHKRSLYNTSEYPAMRDFYKKMYDLVNEPIVLKRAS